MWPAGHVLDNFGLDYAIILVMIAYDRSLRRHGCSIVQNHSPTLSVSCVEICEEWERMR